MPDNSEDTPVLDTLTAMTAVSVAECDLPSAALLLVRLAALAAVDAGPASYLLHIGPAAEAGITIEDAAERPRRCGSDHRDGPGHVGRDQHCRGTGIGDCSDRGGVGVTIRSADDGMPADRRVRDATRARQPLAAESLREIVEERSPSFFCLGIVLWRHVTSRLGERHLRSSLDFF